jgi:myo-inositol-1(or 4)-monophosphatase
MKLTQRIRKALEIAEKQHRGQYRKNGVTPYLLHPVSVAWRVSGYTQNEDTIITAILHDVVEDTANFGIEEIEVEFGERVAENITYLSKNVGLSPKGGCWLDNKKQYIERLDGADKEVLLVKIIDRIDNANTLVKELENNGEEFWEKFNGKKNEKKIVEELSLELFRKKKMPKELCEELEGLIGQIYN